PTLCPDSTLCRSFALVVDGLQFAAVVGTIRTLSLRIDRKTRGNRPGAGNGRFQLQGCAIYHPHLALFAQTANVDRVGLLNDRQRCAVNEQTNTVYITGLGKESVIWVVDGATLKLKTTITGTGAMATGLAIDPQAKRLYTTNADGELLTIDSESNTIASRKKLQDDGKAHFYLNLSLDTAGHRAFITDSKQPEVLVVDTRDGKVLEKIAAPESLAVLFNPARNEAYVTHRKAGEVSVIDGKSYKVVKTFKTPTHPNSLALSEDGKTLYVSVKQASSREKEATAPDDVIRIAL
ncbi:YncE family protein, partial [Klebsiella pneumoniae]|uniref:YncE family protein n=1 Tax=Klebsiella pneumoniae TaxID=573 RepID=UPI001CECF842